jgi:hypothetical protein
MREPLLVVLVGLFIAVTVLRVVKAYFLARRLKDRASDLPEGADTELVTIIEGAKTPQRARDAIRNISHLAHGVQSPAVRSAYYSAAGNLALNPLKRPGLAVGLFLKALRADPTCVEGITKLQEILSAQKRLRRLEWTYWEVLARLDDSEVGEDMWLACWSGLAAIYAASPRTVRRADAIRKALNAFVPDSEDDEAGDGEATPSTSIPKVSIVEDE